ncbi:MAG TPA: ABC transporter substrate-binding protein [Stellaceae bacterium]|nr:ABC transporter substrate-binding protein [Stellaceae bacterium]
MAQNPLSLRSDAQRRVSKAARKTYGMLAIMALLAAFIAPASAAAIAHFTAASPSEPDTFDITATRDPGGCFVVLQNIYEQLWGFDADNKPVKTVADWTIAPDWHTITFRLHPGVKFQSGDALTAADVVFSFKRIAANSPMYRRDTKLVDKVEALDRDTVRFTFNTPYFGFFNSGIVYLVSKAYFERKGEAYAVTHPNGIGPYQFVDYQPAQYVDLAASPNYYGKPPEVRAARIYFVKDEQTRLARLKAGEADLIMDTPYPAIDGLKKDGFRVVGAESWPVCAVQFQLNNPQSPWHDKRVRLAIAHAIDGDAIVKGLLQGIPKRYPGLAQGEFGYDPDLKNYTYDPALAKKLLAEAGYANGFTMPLYYWAGTFYGIRETAEAVALYLRAVGITAKPEGLDPTKVMAMLRRGASDTHQVYAGVMAMPITNTGMDPTESVGLMYLSSGAVSNYKNPELDAIIHRMLGEFDNAKRAADVRQAIRLVHDEAADIPIWDSISEYAMNAKFAFTPIQHRNAVLLLADVRTE